jgi:hypothetical protein
MISYVTQRVAKALADAPHRLIIETYWNTTTQKINIWSIAFIARRKENSKRYAEAMSEVG